MNLTGNYSDELEQLGFTTYVLDLDFKDPFIDDKICQIIQKLIPIHVEKVFVAEPKLKPLIPRVIAAIHGRTESLPVVVHMIKHKGKLEPVYTDLSKIQRNSRRIKALELNKTI